MNEREYKALKKYQDDEKSRIKKGCDSFREKIRNVRQDFQAPVNKGTRSISGRIAEETFELLTEKWGRLPCLWFTRSLSFGIDGDTFSKL